MPTPWTGIIAPTRAIDWSQAGVTGGIPNRSTICATINPMGTQGSPVAPTSINSALISCVNGVVLLTAGNYWLTTDISFNSTGPHNNVTLRGAGADKTFLYFTTGSVNLTAWSGSGGTANWTGGYSQGTTSITLDSVSGLTANQSMIYLHQCDDGLSGALGACNSGTPVDNGQVFTCTENKNYCSNQGTGGAASSQVQVVVPTAISGTGPYNVTIDRPLYGSNWNSAQSPYAHWVSSPLTGSGIEDLSVDVVTTGSTNNPIAFNTTLNCWVKGCRLIGGHTKIMDVFFAPRSSIVNNYVTSMVGGALAYPISLDNSGDILELNNIITYAGGPIIDEPESGDVIAYNYSRDYWGQINNQFTQNWFDDHTAAWQFSLLEGNQLGIVNEDAVHGTHDLNTFFRNQITTFDGFTQLTKNTSAFFLRWGARFMNVIGNVLGTPSWNTQYECTAPSCVSSDFTIYTLGTSSGPVFNDGLVKPTLMRWGNYDTVNNAVQWNSGEVPSSLTAGAGFTATLSGSGVGPYTATLANTPIQPFNSVINTGSVYGYDVNGTGTITGTGIASGSINLSTGVVTVTFSASTSSAVTINYVQQTGSASIYANPLPASHTLPNSFFLTANTRSNGGTGLPWWKVCTNYPTCSTTQINPFPAIGPDVVGGNGAGGFAYDIPAAIAWKTLPVDPFYQKSYTVTNAVWSGGTVTLTVSGMGTNPFIGEFTVSGITPSGYNGTYIMTGSSTTTVKYALASSPGTYSSGGTMLFPNVRQFNETVYMNDPASGGGGGGGNQLGTAVNFNVTFF